MISCCCRSASAARACSSNAARPAAVGIDSFDLLQRFDRVDVLACCDRLSRLLQLTRHPSLLRLLPPLRVGLLDTLALAFFLFPLFDGGEFAAKVGQRGGDRLVGGGELLQRGDRLGPAASAKLAFLLLDRLEGQALPLGILLPLADGVERPARQCVRFGMGRIVPQHLAGGADGGLELAVGQTGPSALQCGLGRALPFLFLASNPGDGALQGIDVGRGRCNLPRTGDELRRLLDIQPLDASPGLIQPAVDQQPVPLGCGPIEKLQGARFVRIEQLRLLTGFDRRGVFLSVEGLPRGLQVCLDGVGAALQQLPVRASPRCWRVRGAASWRPHDESSMRRLQFG